MNIELTRFRVNLGKSEQVDEWLKFLNDHMVDLVTEVVMIPAQVRDSMR